MHKSLLILLISFYFLISNIAFAFIDVSFNLYSSVYYFKPNNSFNSSTQYVHKGHPKTKWDLDGGGFYFSTSLNIIEWLKPAFFIGKASFSEKITSFNDYSNPEYQVSQYDWGFDVKIFPFKRYLYAKLGLIRAKSSHMLLTSNASKVEIFNFKGDGYEAGFGIDIPFERGCFDYNCGIGIEYIARKTWATDLKIKLDEIEHDDSKKSSYRAMMLGMGLFWYY